MRILILTPVFPYPPHNDGVAVGVYNQIIQLKKLGHVITLISFVDDGYKEEYKSVMSEYCEKIITEKIEKKISIIKRLSKKISLKPYQVNRYYSKNLENRIKEEIKNEKYDLLYSFQIHMAQYFNNYGIFKVLSANDAWSLFNFREAKKEKKIIKKLDYFLEGIKHRIYEVSEYKKYNFVTMVSDVDKEYVRSFSKSNKIYVIPYGVDSSYFKPLKEKTKNDTKSLVFTGIMSYKPNSSSAMFFYSEVFKHLDESIKYYIVGKSPSNEIKNLEKENRNVIVTGFVEDIRTYINEADIYVAPLISGTGIKNKVLEAMSMGKAIIATKLATDGIDELKDGENIIIEDNPIKMRNAIVHLLNNKDEIQRIGECARKLVVDKYSWESVVKRINNLFIENIRNINK